MAKTGIIRARTELSLKEEVEKIFEHLGLTASVAINLFYQQVKLTHGLPFEVKIPKKSTLKTFKRTDSGKGIVECGDTKKMFESLGI
ncbi:MAG TPA: type II toxin-antitoxin system RelB/DinJ family antitoxin [Candidatus Wallbacteria bacterium]|nr:type II toxin-antitoxin system RelB/DinJ family antitoxin [Candidatus Wallbacteria bacterium]